MPIKAICVHGHFYQPPREDPITGKIPIEPGASPFRNWNERIHSECYRPNAELGNFERLSFNFGPTLSTWIETYDQITYTNILAQDRLNMRRYGIGNAIAQPYNHTILPLAKTSDKTIQIAWGIADFRHRFQREPKGMWLPETAVDLETLTIMANQGIQFTILAPWQADSDSIDLTEPYRILLPGGKSIIVFFYHGELSAKISFEPRITTNADDFSRFELLNTYRHVKESRNEPQLLLLASDGELYGHHQPYRERFLSHLLDGASSKSGIIPVYPALWLEQYPPTRTIGIRERTSWSCHHGVDRWMHNCSCTNQDGVWKSHLRRSIDRLATNLDDIYFDYSYSLISNPRSLRKEYIQVVLGETQVDRLINEMASSKLKEDQVFRLKLLLKSQFERQRMFTSCGWFFEDFDRIEPKNVVAYAAQAVRLVRLATGDDLSNEASLDLSKVVSPKTGLRGDTVFQHHLNRTWTLNSHYR
jgi:alpha-amylase/alpha-mannosidase (GH57 family)